MIFIRDSKRKGAMETNETQREEPTGFNIPENLDKLLLDCRCEEVDEKHRSPGIVEPAKTGPVLFVNFLSRVARACLISDRLADGSWAG
jgi:hypothetical protein